MWAIHLSDQCVFQYRNAVYETCENVRNEYIAKQEKKITREGSHAYAERGACSFETTNGSVERRKQSFVHGDGRVAMHKQAES